MYITENNLKIFSTVNKYNEERKKIIFKCQCLRKDEKLKKEINQSLFCQGTIEYIEHGQNVNSLYFFKGSILLNMKRWMVKLK